MIFKTVPSHNWREIGPKKAAAFRFPDRWVPACPNNHLEVPLRGLSSRAGDPIFLRPNKGSPLATAGAGQTDPSLPSYIGAVRLEGVEPED
jgi:hypothetical protein